MSEATIEYKNSPNESTAYAVTEGQKTKVQLVATPAGDLELADNPNVDTGYLVINGEKHKCALVAEVDGELKLPTSATDDTGYVTTQDGRQHKVKLVANITGGGTQINNQNINVTQNGIYQAEEGYTGLGTVNVNVASGSPTQKFGVTIDNFLGNVDVNGNYTAPSEMFVFDLSGVKNVDSYNTFSYVFFNNKRLSGVIANDIVSLGSSVFSHAFNGADSSSFFYFDGLETVDGYATFSNAFKEIHNTACVFSFKKLKTILGKEAFASAFDSFYITPVVDDVFPALEVVSGEAALSNFIKYKAATPITFSHIKTITGGTTTYQATFGTLRVANTVWNFPSATEFTGLIWNAGTTYPGEIHFAAANQAAIEACDGYANKWGFASATIFFDL